MAIARDPVLEELKRSISASASLNHSTLSLEGLQQSDIGEWTCTCSRTCRHGRMVQTAGVEGMVLVILRCLDQIKCVYARGCALCL